MIKTFVLLAAMTFAAAAFAVETGKPAPDFTGTDINGKTVKLSDYAGKIVVIESYNSDCPFDTTITRPARCRIAKGRGDQRRRVAARGFREHEEFQLPHARTGAARNSPTRKWTRPRGLTTAPAPSAIFTAWRRRRTCSSLIRPARSSMTARLTTNPTRSTTQDRAQLCPRSRGRLDCRKTH